MIQASERSAWTGPLFRRCEPFSRDVYHRRRSVDGRDRHGAGRFSDPAAGLRRRFGEVIVRA